MAHVHTALIRWNLGDTDFLSKRYSRAHSWTFDGGVVVPASSSPLVVPLPMSDAGAVDPEEAFVAALSSCHMLWFLDIASRAGFAIASYEDAAEGRMGRNAAGKLVVDLVILHPRARVTGARVPDAATLAALHHEAHEECFLANSVRCEIRCEPVLE
jgi:organic hydroperoxide reductase OsmC/OhrA